MSDELPDGYDDRYEPVRWAVGNQQRVANAWAQMKFPVHEGGEFRSGSGNFKGFNNPSGSGLLKHYSTIEAIRTRFDQIISNSECYSRGWAHCSVPSTSVLDHEMHSLPLSTMAAKLGKQTLYEITDIEVADTEDDGYTNLTDDEGYDRLVTIQHDDGVAEYRAAKGKFDDDPLSDAQANDFLTTIHR